jgi:nucleotide-binding universal stress UspA family protein
LDGSPLAEGIIPFVTDIAGPLDMSVILLRVVPPVIREAPLMGPHALMKDLDGNMAAARDYLGAIGEEFWRRGVRAQSRVRRGLPAAEIVAAGRETGADLIAMTTHGRTGFKRLIYGSIAEAVLREADSPVLLMRLNTPSASSRAAHSNVLPAEGGYERADGFEHHASVRRVLLESRERLQG